MGGAICLHVSVSSSSIVNIMPAVAVVKIESEGDLALAEQPQPLFASLFRDPERPSVAVLGPVGSLSILHPDRQPSRMLGFTLW